MSVGQWLKKNKVNLRKCSNTVADHRGNVCIERPDGTWALWIEKEVKEVPSKYWR